MQHLGQTHSYIHSVKTRRICFPPPGTGGDAVREGGHTLETRAASSDMPPHHPACMRARCDAPVALLPSKAPVPPNPGVVDHGI